MGSGTGKNGAAPPLEILVVEDDLGDAILLTKYLESTEVPNRVNVVTDGQEASDYLQKNGKYEGARRPDLVFLDLNLPRKDGREVLREIKDDPALKEIPVLVLSTSSWEMDVNGAYEDQANLYLVKPTDLDNFLASMRYVEDVWLRTIVHREG